MKRFGPRWRRAARRDSARASRILIAGHRVVTKVERLAALIRRRSEHHVITDHHSVDTRGFGFHCDVHEVRHRGTGIQRPVLRENHERPSGGHASSCGLNSRCFARQPTEGRIRLVEEFRVPLHGEHVMTGQFEGLDHPSGRWPTLRVVAQHGQGLVVQRVHANCLRVQRGEQGPGTTFTSCVRS